MNTRNKLGNSTKKMVTLALLTAIVAILAYFGGFIKIGGLASISLTLIPVVVGAALCGPLSGAWLGLVSGVIFFITADAAFWLGLSIPGTIITVLVKGALAGLAAGYAYKLLERINVYVAVFSAAIICPIVNTGIFLLGSSIFFIDFVKSSAVVEGMNVGAYLIIFFVGLNFVFELLANILLSPTIVRILSIGRLK